MEPEIDEFGNQRWYGDGGVCRKVYPSGAEKWYKNGRLHREDGPAITDSNRSEWYKDGRLHREDGPAIIFINGTKKWYREGRLHREDGPAVVEANGTLRYFVDNKKHREDGPAVIEYDMDGKLWRLAWYQNDRLHREDGPAMEGYDLSPGPNLGAIQNLPRITDYMALSGSPYFLKGKPVDVKLFKKVLTCPVEELPLYIGTEVECVVKSRFEKGE